MSPLFSPSSGWHLRFARPQKVTAAVLRVLAALQHTAIWVANNVQLHLRKNEDTQGHRVLM